MAYTGTVVLQNTQGLAEQANWFNQTPYAAQGRMTLASGTPVTTTDIPAGSVVYWTPYNGNRCAVFDGTANWDVLEFAEIELDISGTATYTADTNFDVFGYNDSGALATEALAWTDDTNRATGLVLQDNILVKDGATTRRYLGSFRTTDIDGKTEMIYSGGASGTTEARLFVWNNYNRVKQVASVTEITGQWTFSGTADYQQMNNDTDNKIEFIIGFIDEPVRATGAVVSVVDTTEIAFVSIGLDAVTAPASGANAARISQTDATEINATLFSQYTGHPGIGYHFLAPIEKAGAGTVGFIGDNAQQLFQGVIYG